MASVNKVILVGNLGKDPEIRYTQSGEPIATLAVATRDQWKDKASGEKRNQPNGTGSACSANRPKSPSNT